MISRIGKTIACSAVAIPVIVAGAGVVPAAAAAPSAVASAAQPSDPTSTAVADQTTPAPADTEPSPVPTPEPTQDPAQGGQAPVPDAPPPVDLSDPVEYPSAGTEYTVPTTQVGQPSKPAPGPESFGSRTSESTVMRTRNTRYSPATAASRLTRWARSGRSGYHNQCLRLADDAYAPHGRRTSTALRQWYRALQHGFGHRNRNAPVGAQLFWRTSNPAGHVATYVGDGMVVTNVPGGRVKLRTWKSIDRWGPYLGWAEPFYS